MNCPNIIVLSYNQMLPLTNGIRNKKKKNKCTNKYLSSGFHRWNVWTACVLNVITALLPTPHWRPTAARLPGMCGVAHHQNVQGFTCVFSQSLSQSSWLRGGKKILPCCTILILCHTLNAAINAICCFCTGIKTFERKSLTMLVSRGYSESRAPWNTVVFQLNDSVPLGTHPSITQ